MTRRPTRRLIALALAAALSVPAFAQEIEPFQVSDVRVDGLQRISAGTVFTYLPIERGDTVNQSNAGDAIRALYKTGFFEDVRLSREGNILVVNVVERPAINKIEMKGNKDIKEDDLRKGLKEIGLEEGDTFDRMSLDRVTQELTRQYNNRGKYNVEINPVVTQLDRNRVNVAINVKEGKAAKIRHINVIGNELFTDKELMDNWESHPTGWLSWYKRDDQYSKERLSGDLEKLQSYYLDRGYIDADVTPDNTQVTISPNKRDLYITAGLTEGEQYKVSTVTVSGDTVLPHEDIEKQVQLFVAPDKVFSRRGLEAANESVAAALSNIGYAFASVNPVPNVDREKRTVSLDFQVNPGPRVNVRRIVFDGNTRTADNVLRREMRQMEGSWYSQAAIDRSKIRLQQLGFFEEVKIESKPVPGTQDQVDLAVSVKETNSGTMNFGVGYSQLGGIQLNGSISERNFMGSGNQLSMALARSSYQKQASFQFLNPYFSKNGMSLGYNIYWSEFDYSNYNTAQYNTSEGAANVTLGIPLTEWDSISWSVGYSRKQVSIFRGSTPQSIVDYIDAVGTRTFNAWRTSVSFARDTRDNYLQPTRGTYQRLGLEVTLPNSTVSYYMLDYQLSKFFPLSDKFVLNTVANVGYGNSYGKTYTRTLSDGRVVTAKGMPFYENFYAGGVSQAGRVRGFVDNTLGPTDASSWGYNQPIGGSIKTIGSLELFFPKLIDSPAARVSAFLDFGNVFADRSSIKASELRASAGVAMMWRSPMGPISISYAIPVRKFPGDRIERLQFSFAGQF
ncbi:outer membrane protein assembly factor BamA [Lysobacter sp. HDW10]|uniref:outer membrane protein assembly factor BamA n=1 Tax=Lysobacter sp. HDW10 TaxID=2714936 RepID=UPI00140E8D18|nr:outer membrane protein assembly factor BamA [Lysobacter sp. HDW10]QIK80180.1 outer membrane protein assembly factor BamA [Lysobacter sp. HDW10]